MVIDNRCIRCGKQRVAVKTWEERVGNSLLTHTLNSCPDPACQKIVEEDFAVSKAKIALLAQKRLEAKAEKIRLSVAKKTSSKQR